MPNVLISPQGKYVELDDDEAGPALKRGYTTPTADQQAEIDKRQKYGQGLGNAVRAGVEGAARGLTFGLSDQLLTRSGLEDKEGVAERKERNPIAEGIGEGVGIIGGGLATGGLGDIGAGVHGAQALGEGATSLAARGLAKVGIDEGSGLAARALGQSLSRGIGSAAEGALYGGGQAISEQALGDPDTLGEKALAHVGLGAIFGGLGGGALGALGEFAGLTKLTRAVRSNAAAPELAPTAESQAARGATEGAEADALAPTRGSESTAAPSEAIPSDMPPQGAPPTGAATLPADIPEAQATIEPMQPAPIERGTLGTALRKMASRVTGIDEGNLDQLLASTPEGAAARRAAMHGVTDEERNEGARKLAAALSENERVANDVEEHAIGSFKADAVRKVISTDNVHEQLNTAQALFSKVRDTLDDMKGKPASYEGNFKKVESWVSDYENRINKAVASGDDVSTTTFRALDDLKRKIGSVTKPDVTLRDSGTAQGFAIRMRDLYDNDFVPELQSTQTWGGAGDMQRELNAAWHPHITNKKQFAPRFLTQTGSDHFNPVFEGDPGKANSYLRSLNTPENDLPKKFLNTHVDTQEHLLKTIAKHIDLEPEQAAKVARLTENNKSLKAAVSHIERDMSLHESAREAVHTTKSLFSHIRAGAAVGGIHAGPIGALAGAGIGALSGAISNAGKLTEMLARGEGAANAVKQAAKMAGVEKASLAIDKTVNKQLDAFFSKVSSTAFHAAPPASVGAMGRIFFKESGMSAQNMKKHDLYKARLDELAELSNNPQNLMDRIQQNLGGLDSAMPHTSSAIQQSALRGLQYLQTKAPQDPVGGQSLNPAHSYWRPSDAELASFERRLQAVQHPLSLLDDLKAGTITAEGVEAVSTVYPKLYHQIIANAMPHLAAAKDIPLQKRMQLATLMQAPVDAMTSAGFTNSIQTMYSNTAIPAGPSNPSAKPANQRATLVQTPMQRALANT